jgi:hypothetical protein
MIEQGDLDVMIIFVVQHIPKVSGAIFEDIPFRDR